ncbi:MAG: MBOAT family O-acyltransferase [Pseudomonadota bacterium]|nr:MBOAT family O-acyltransferase [Pseudomonadota bacterium]
MTFVQVQFLGFFAVVFAAYWSFPSRVGQNAILLVASLYFYGCVHPWFLILLAYSTLFDYAVCLAMQRYPERAKALLALSVVGSLLLLGIFKYLDFFIESFAALQAELGLRPSVAALGIVLPVGISFYTFQTMSYAFDVYKGTLQPRRSLLDYATYVVMFPQLVAGPIERARSLLPQVEAVRTLDWQRVRSGLGLAFWGAVKKIVVADTIGMYVGSVFAMQQPSKLLIAAGTVGFAVQILADFGGYTDIARGTARMLGLELTKNFAHPYLAASPSEFWRRWHISLSSWIHEYLYVPLGGSGRGPLRRLGATYGALLLSGLWHGASWNFVIWGGYHATLLSAYRVGGALIPARVRTHPRLRPVAIVVMFGFTCLGWLLFREQSLAKLRWIVTEAPWVGTAEHAVLTTAMAAVAALCGGALVLALVVERALARRNLRIDERPFLLGAGWGACALVIFLFSRDTASDFIYFRF